MSGKRVQALVKSKQALAVLDLIFTANPSTTDADEKNTIEYATWAARDLIQSSIELLEADNEENVC